MAALLAMLAAISWGSGDFLGGRASRSLHVVSVTATAQIVSLPLLAVATPLVGASVDLADLVIPGLGGALGASGLVLLYNGLANGRTAVIAPVTGLVAAAGPTLWGAARGESVSAPATAGLAIGLAAIVAISTESGATATRWSTRRSVLVALLSGLGFAAFIVALDTAPDDAGIAPVLAARLVSVPLLIVLATSLAPSVIVGSHLFVVSAAGVLDAGANALLVLALAEGQLIVVSVLSSLYPAMTVLLARIVDDERLERIQLIGLGLAVVAVVLITAN